MPNGGEVSMNPLLLSQFGQQGSQDRGNVTVVSRSPVTVFGFDAEMDGKVFKVSWGLMPLDITLPADLCARISSSTLQPVHDETKNTFKFLQDATRWLQEEKIQVLPSVNAQRQGIDGLEQALDEIKVHHLASINLSLLNLMLTDACYVSAALRTISRSSSTSDSSRPSLATRER